MPSSPNPEDGSQFRWSFDEMKLLVRRPFSSGSLTSGESSKSMMSLIGPKNAPRDKKHANSKLEFRKSFTDLKYKFRGLRTRDKDGNGVVRKKTKKKRKRVALTPQEREARRIERQKIRRAKKSVREKERRQTVNHLFNQLGSVLGIDSENKDKTVVLQEAVHSLNHLKATGRLETILDNERRAHLHDDDDEEDEFGYLDDSSSSESGSDSAGKDCCGGRPAGRWYSTSNPLAKVPPLATRKGGKGTSPKGSKSVETPEDLL